MVTKHEHNLAFLESLIPLEGRDLNGWLAHIREKFGDELWKMAVVETIFVMLPTVTEAWNKQVRA